MSKSWYRHLFDILFIIVGSLFTALALDWFLVPNQIAAGGVSGLATIIYHWLGYPVGIVTVVMNLPLIILAIFFLGWSAAFKTIVGSLLLGFFTDLFFPIVPALTHDALLAAISGGLLSGVGMGLCFNGGGSTGGTDIAALLLTRQARRYSLGNMIFIFDGIVLLLAAIAFAPEYALYALMSLIVSSIVINTVQEGLPYARQILIITSPDKATAISKAIFSCLGRGVTQLSGRGMYTGDERCLLLVVVERGELHMLTEIVADLDEDAFTSISDARRVLGNGFDRARFKY